jgi:hypothetical protein
MASVGAFCGTVTCHYAKPVEKPSSAKPLLSELRFPEAWKGISGWLLVLGRDNRVPFATFDDHEPH